jgi:hypothetical protein
MPEDDEDSIYGEDYLGEAEENDEVDELEEGFMKGYDQENSELCGYCHKVLTGYDDTIEIEINNKLYKFCSERCADKFKKKNKR